jgi:hypothetical protein
MSYNYHKEFTQKVHTKRCARNKTEYGKAIGNRTRYFKHEDNFGSTEKQC